LRLGVVRLGERGWRVRLEVVERLRRGTGSVMYPLCAHDAHGSIGRVERDQPSVFVTIGDRHGVGQGHVLPHVPGRKGVVGAAVEVVGGRELQLLPVVRAQREALDALDRRAYDFEQDTVRGPGRRRGRGAAREQRRADQRGENTQKPWAQPRSSLSRWVNAGSTCFQSPTIP
jgi:hypothetical protein